MFELAIQVTDAHVDCLAQAIYHEARGESYIGQVHVGYVILNRVNHDSFPNDICSVIEQPYQFSYMHELASKNMYELEAKEFSYDVANIIINTDNPFPESMLYFHGDHMVPGWNFDLLEQFAHIGNHIFYLEK